MGNVIRLTESDLTRIVKRMIIEQKNQELITEGLGDLIKTIKAKFSKNKEEDIKDELKTELNIDQSTSKNEVIEKVKTYFKGRKEYVHGNIDRIKKYLLNIAARIGSAFKYFVYIILIYGETSFLVQDPFTFLGIAIYLFLQGKTKIGDKEINFKN